MKILFTFLVLLAFCFSNEFVLLDRMVTKPYEICPIGKKHRKRFFLLEIREYKRKSAIYIFEKINDSYKFIYGFNLDFLGKEVYFSGYKDYHKTNDADNFKKNYLYWCMPKTKYESGNFVVLIGGKFSKKEVDSYIKKKKNKNPKYPYHKLSNAFYGKGKILLFIPENKNRKAFFTTFGGKHSTPLQWIKYTKKMTDKGKAAFIIPQSDSAFRGPFTLTLNSYSKGEFNKIIGFSSEQKSFRDKYYFDLTDLKAKGIPEPKPMWDSKVKPYKNVFGEELLD